jgi:hypothetical protein
MRRWAIALAAGALFSAAPAQSIRPFVTTLLLDPADATVDEVGQLRFLGGLDLTSPQPEFGGISGLRVMSDGQLLAVTDAGHWLELTTQEEDERLVGIRAMQLSPLLDEQGKALADKANQDAEAMAQLADGSGIVVTFERRNEAVVYRGAGTVGSYRPAERIALPGADGLPVNGGIEAFAVIGPGSYVAISEEGTGPGSSYLAWRVTPEQTFTFGYEPPRGYVATDAILVDDDSLLVLNRRFSVFSGVAAALVRVPLAAIRPGVLVSGEVIAELVPPLTVDNMEGVALKRTSDGRAMLYLVSDNNFSDRQRTILMKFAWPDAN